MGRVQRRVTCSQGETRGLQAYLLGFHGMPVLIIEGLVQIIY